MAGAKGVGRPVPVEAAAPKAALPHASLNTIRRPADPLPDAGHSGYQEQPLLLTVEQAAALLNLSRTRVYGMLARGELESLAITPGCRRVPRQAVLDWI